MKLKMNKLQHYEQSVRDCDSYLFPFCIEENSSQRKVVVPIQIGIRELENGRITLDTFERKLKSAARSLHNLLFYGSPKQRKLFIKRLQKSLKWKRKEIC